MISFLRNNIFIIGSVGMVLLIILFGCYIPYISAVQDGIEQERHIVTLYEDMENTLSAHTLKVIEAAQVPDMYKEDAVALTEAAFTGGKPMMMLANFPAELKEKLYTNIQHIQESGRNEFKNKQTKFIEVKSLYQAELDYDIFGSRGFWLGVAGFPRIEMDQYVMISSREAVKVFDTKRNTTIKLR